MNVEPANNRKHNCMSSQTVLNTSTVTLGDTTPFYGRSLKKFTWRLDPDTKVFADCAEFKFTCPSELFQSKRPDIVLVKGKKVTVLELTVCFETNSKKSRVQDRYKKLRSELNIQCDDFNVIYFEVTTLDFIRNNSLEQIKPFLSEHDRTIWKQLYIRASYYIFC